MLSVVCPDGVTSVNWRNLCFQSRIPTESPLWTEETCAHSRRWSRWSHLFELEKLMLSVVGPDGVTSANWRNLCSQSWVPMESPLWTGETHAVGRGSRWSHLYELEKLMLSIEDPDWVTSVNWRNLCSQSWVPMASSLWTGETSALSHGRGRGSRWSHFCELEKLLLSVMGPDGVNWISRGSRWKLLLHDCLQLTV